MFGEKIPTMFALDQFSGRRVSIEKGRRKSFTDKIRQTVYPQKFIPPTRSLLDC